MARKPSSRLRILILTCTIGGAHTSSSDAISRYLKAHHAEKTDVHVMDFFAEVLPELVVLAQLGYQRAEGFLPAFNGRMGAEPPALQDNPYLLTLRDRGLDRIRTLLERGMPDVVVTMLPAIAGAVCEARGSAAHPAVASVITGMTVGDAWLHPDADVTFVALKESREELVMRGMAWDRVVVSGVPVAERFCERSEPADARERLGMGERPAIFVAGDASSAPAQVEICTRLVANGVRVFAYTRGDAQVRARLEAVCTGARGSWVTSRFSEAVDLLMASEVVVTAVPAGVVAESLAAKRPFIIYNAVPGQEQSTFDLLVNWGACLVARDGTDAADKAAFLIGNPSRHAAMRDAVDGLGRSDGVRVVGERVVALGHRGS